LIVLDASVVVSAAVAPAGVAARAVDHAARRGRIALSDEVQAEIVAVLARPKIAARSSLARRAEVLALVIGAAERFARTECVTDCRDAKDNKYLELALAARAEVIVPGDDDLLVLHPWRGVRIVSPAAFVAEPPLT